jgi:lauroyl/myristoyl acyltransferase
VKRATFRHRVEYGLVVIVRGIVGVLPDVLSRALGTFIGLTFYVIDGAHRRLAVKQLRAAFPTREPGECRAIARATFAHFGRLLVALLRFSKARIACTARSPQARA